MSAICEIYEDHKLPSRDMIHISHAILMTQELGQPIRNYFLNNESPGTSHDWRRWLVT